MPKPVGIFAAHDPLGRFLCRVCQQCNLRVPDDVAIIAANNDELVCGLSYPMLSSVAIPWDTIATLTAESMMDLLSGKPPRNEPILVKPGSVQMRHSANHLLVEDADLRRAMNYFAKRLQDCITVGSMCSELRISRRGLERKFAEFYHCSPWGMLSRLRIDKAKHLTDNLDRFAMFHGPA